MSRFSRGSFSLNRTLVRSGSPSVRPSGFHYARAYRNRLFLSLRITHVLPISGFSTFIFFLSVSRRRSSRDYSLVNRRWSGWCFRRTLTRIFRAPRCCRCEMVPDLRGLVGLYIYRLPFAGIVLCNFSLLHFVRIRRSWWWRWRWDGYFFFAFNGSR